FGGGKRPGGVPKRLQSPPQLWPASCSPPGQGLNDAQADHLPSSDDGGFGRRLRVGARGGRPVMRAALPARYEALAPRSWQAANDPHSLVMVGGIETACLSRDALARTMLHDCLSTRSDARRQPKLVFASNGHIIATAARDPSFRAIFQQADIVHAD